LDVSLSVFHLCSICVHLWAKIFLVNLELLVNEHCGCGENPLWDERRGILFWCDIPAGHIWAFDPKANTHRLVADVGRECGAFTLEESGELLLLFVGDAALLDPDSGAVRPLRQGFLENTERFNDCIAAPDGSVFAGTVDWSRGERGGLFHLHRDFSIHQLTANSACSNGLGWTPDGRGLVWADSTSRVTWLWEFDPQTGEVGDKRRWLHTPENTPDGLTTDENGGVWLTFFDGPFLRHYDAEATLVEQIEFPAKHATSAIFGGEDLSEIYITTAGGHPNSSPDDPSGALFRLRPGARGMKEHRSRLGAI